MKKKLILDIGAHTGRDSQFYLRKGFQVVAIEPYAPHAQQIRSRLADDISRKDLTVDEVAIGESVGTYRFYVHETSEDWHRSATDHLPTNEFAEISVLYTDASSLFAKYYVPYYIKVDIENSDWLAVMAISAERKPTFVSFEVSANAEECLRHLNSIGYNSFQIVDQSKNHQTIPPFPPREGKFVDVKFDGYMSGLFGFELPDLWNDFEVIKTAITNLDWSNNQWYDLHASVLAHRAGKLAGRGDQHLSIIDIALWSHRISIRFGRRILSGSRHLRPTAAGLVAAFRTKRRGSDRSI